MNEALEEALNKLKETFSLEKSANSARTVRLF